LKTLARQKLRLSIPWRSRVFCISHNDDADGLASAALVRCATGCRFALAGYEHIERVLADAPRGLDWLIVTDLGFDEKLEVIRSLSAIARHVLYVDHHMLSAESKRALRKAKVIVRHSLKDCASVLVWDLLRRRLPEEAVNLAAYGAVTDPPTSGLLTREVHLRTSWNVDAYEGHLLALALSSKRCTDGLREKIVKGLAALQLPHQIGEVRRLADQQAGRMIKIQKQLCDRARVRGRVAIARAGPLALGTSAELLLGVPNVVASVVYSRAESPSRTRVSVRGTVECRRHLGKLILRIAREFGGAGGGHMLAAGAILPSQRLEEFLDLFVRKV
jgi:RecJ-like exonuclease